MSDNVPATPAQFTNIESSSQRQEKGGLNLKEDAGAIAQHNGEMGKSKREIDSAAIHEVLADMIYDSDDALIREYLQNAETACIRAAKLLLSMHDDYGTEWLTVTKTLEDGTTAEFDRPVSQVLEAAESIGYVPIIEITLYVDERKLVIQDNGIGMTAREIDDGFNTTGMSGVRHDAATGGKIGIGSLTYINATGEQGDITGGTCTRNQNAPEIDQQGIKFIADLDGVEEVQNDLPDDFRGTRFEIPVCEPHDGGFKLSRVEEWVDKYTQGLRVSTLYTEYENSNKTVEEEHEGQSIAEKYDNPPIQVERPGEFSLVAGPEIELNYNDDGCYLVSMPIDMNRSNSYHSMSIFTCVIQIHNEQGLIVEGPNRGKLENEVDRLHDDDVPLPQPKADRDSLQRGTANTRFFNLVEDAFEKREIDVASEFVHNAVDADDIIDYIGDNPGEYKTFRNIVGKHGPLSRHSKTSSASPKAFANFCQQEDSYPTLTCNGMTVQQWQHRGPKLDAEFNERDIDEDPLDVIGTYEIPDPYIQIAHSQNGIERAPEGGSRYSSVTTKKGRTTMSIGQLAQNCSPSHVFMAASTSGRFHDRAKVAWNTHDNAEVIVVDGVSDYDKYSDTFGFQKLKNVPYKSENNDGEWDIPAGIKETKTTTTSKSTGKPDDVLQHVLKIRTSADNSINKRLPITTLVDRFDSGGKGINNGNPRHLVLVRRTDDQNISDNYEYAENAALASCTNEEYDALSDCSRVYTIDEYDDMTQNTVIATEDGAMTAQELIDDDRQVILAHVDSGNELLTDDMAEMRQYLQDDLQQSHYNDYETGILWAVVSAKTYQRVAPVFDNQYVKKGSLLSYSHNVMHGYATKYRTLSESRRHYELLIKTDDWDDNSRIYDALQNIDEDYMFEQGQKIRAAILALHELGVDPTEASPEEIKEKIVY